MKLEKMNLRLNDKEFKVLMNKNDILHNLQTGHTVICLNSDCGS